MPLFQSSNLETGAEAEIPEAANDSDDDGEEGSEENADNGARGAPAQKRENGHEMLVTLYHTS